ncbi:MAG: PilN domain-containing protein [Elusimicrobia bacterium]|jgi:Tfp pilus assembly protein PilN|nr:PilN domain-containing protein [Elusimicrobiota bacterium]
MIRINLLPKEIAQKAAAKKRGILIAWIVLLVVAIFIGIYLLRVAKLTAVNGDIKEVQSELNKLESTVKKVNDIQKRKDRLNRKITVIKNLMKSRLLYPIFFEEMAMVMPSSVWLTSLNTSTGEGKLTLSMGVNAADNYAVADFINALEISDNFTDIKFSGISTSSSGGEDGKKIKVFNINCTYIEKKDN